MNTAELILRLKAEQKSPKTEITESNGFVNFRYPRKGWQRISRLGSDQPIESHLKTLQWVEQHA